MNDKTIFLPDMQQFTRQQQFNLNYLYYFNEVKLQNEDIFAVQEVEISVLKLSGKTKLVFFGFEQDSPEQTRDMMAH